MQETSQRNSNAASSSGIENTENRYGKVLAESSENAVFGKETSDGKRQADDDDNRMTKIRRTEDLDQKIQAPTIRRPKPKPKPAANLFIPKKASLFHLSFLVDLISFQISLFRVLDKLHLMLYIFISLLFHFS